MQTKIGVIWTYSDKVSSAQDNPDTDADEVAADATADESNPSMSLSQATQKGNSQTFI